MFYGTNVTAFKEELKSNVCFSVLDYACSKVTEYDFACKTARLRR